MINKRKNELRIEYLARVLYHFVQDNPIGEYTIDYDGTTCDGYCLAQDFMDEFGIDAGEPNED